MSTKFSNNKKFPGGKGEKPALLKSKLVEPKAEEGRKLIGVPNKLTPIKGKLVKLRQKG